MKNTLILFIYTFFFVFHIYPQGIEFSTYEAETVNKSSYDVFATESPVFNKYFALKFDLAIHDHSSFGYIFRIKDRNSTNPDIYSLVFSYDTYISSHIKLNIEARTGLMTDTLDNAKLRARHWMPVEIRFYLEDDSITLAIRDKQFVSRGLGLPSSMKPEILFGSSTFSQEMPPFAIRNLSVDNKDKTYQFPLNESTGSDVHDNKGKVIGKAINPIWIINKSYHWNQAWTYRSNQVTGSSFDPVN